MSPPINAASYVLSVDGVAEVTYSELVEMRSEVEPAPPTTDPTGAIVHTKNFGTTIPPTVTLRRGLDENQFVWAWHTAVLTGDPASRKTCSLQLRGGNGQVLLTFVLENAWLGTVDIGSPPPPQPPIVMQTDTFVCAQIIMQA